MTSLLPVEDALKAVLEEAKPLGSEMVALEDAGGRVLAAPLPALRMQPPFAASAMDGYAVLAKDIATVPATLTVIGESAAGRRFKGGIKSGEAVRIFTGAPLPDGADTILIQENTSRDADCVTALEPAEPGRFVRPAGLDFSKSDELLYTGTLLTSSDLALAASMNHPKVPVFRKPRVAIIATGDELVLPGEDLSPDQIIASNTFGVAEMVRNSGGEAIGLGIARDTEQSLREKFEAAEAVDADVIVTLGGASVGEHDLVHSVFTEAGVDYQLWKIAMRPGKPFMFGRKNNMRILGLPGNPVSSLVCAKLFLEPLVRTFVGLSVDDGTVPCRLSGTLPANDLRQDYIRAIAERDTDGSWLARPFPRQDSSMLALHARANCLIVRMPHAPAVTDGAECQMILLD